MRTVLEITKQVLVDDVGFSMEGVGRHLRRFRAWIASRRDASAALLRLIVFASGIILFEVLIFWLFSLLRVPV